MEKFQKLDRTEMRKVTGGNLHYCVMHCLRDGFDIISYVADCSADSTAACTFGGYLKSCTCDIM